MVFSLRPVAAVTKGVALAAVSSVIAVSAARADLVTFDPYAAGLASQGPYNADNLNLSDFANIFIVNANGSFTETGVLSYTLAQNGTDPIAAGTSGLSNGTGANAMGFYVTFSGAGQLENYNPANPTALVGGSFSSLTYQMYGNKGATDQVRLVGTNSYALVDTSVSCTPKPACQEVPVAGNTNNKVLSTGGLFPGGANTVGINGTPNADVTVGLNLTSAGKLFFSAPTDLVSFETAFTNTRSVTTFAAGPNGTEIITINGGGGNTTFNVAEPGSMMLVGTALVGLGLLGRASKKA